MIRLPPGDRSGTGSGRRREPGGARLRRSDVEERSGEIRRSYMSDEHGRADDPDSEFHLGSADDSVYRFLLKGPATLPDCCAATGLDEDTVARALADLTRSKLVRPLSTQPRSWLAVSSNLAFLRYLTRLRTEYTALSRQTRSLNAVLDELRTAMSEDTFDRRAMVGIEKLEDSPQTRRTLAELLAGAQHSVRAMHPTVSSDEEVRADFSSDRTLHDRGIEVRSIYPHTARRQREGLNYLRHIQRIGGQLRTTVAVPSRVILIDDRVAVLLRSRNDGGIIAREPNIVGFFEQLFEDTWDRALPVSEYDYDKDVWREIELLVLVELSTGRSDEAIARRLDISTRTLRRYITGLYERFGVETRFQLGVAAARAGVLPGEPGLD
nr:LuxR C-terminal-related transcriptional regulator [Saccharomonospora xinjiangensis]